MTDQLNIRPYKENDDLAITEYSLPKKQAIYTCLPLDVIYSFKKDKLDKPFVIYLGDHLIGFFALNGTNPYTKNENAILLKSFSIDSRFQRKGYAFKSLRIVPRLINKCFPEKDEMILTVHHTNAPAINLYKKAGFLDYGLRFDGEYGEELIFHYRLTGEIY